MMPNYRGGDRSKEKPNKDTTKWDTEPMKRNQNKINRDTKPKIL